MPQSPERSTVGIEITFKDSNGALIDVANITGFLLEVHGSKPGMTNPIAALTSTIIPTANPNVYVLDLSAQDVDAVGDRLFVEWKVTYTDSVLGAGAIMRSEKPLTIHLLDHRISS